MMISRTVRPLGYSIPMDGPVGEMVQAQSRHGFRPSHIHFLIGGEGFRELVTALYFGDDVHIDSDTVFGVSGSLVVGAKGDPKKIVECDVACDEAHGMLIVVRDPGPGFDVTRIPDPCVGENIFSNHGRGIYLINQLMDEVRFHKNGTEIHMIKR